MIFRIMNPSNEPQTNISNPPRLPLKTVLRVMTSPVRWQILKELSTGELLLASEIAKSIGRSPDLTSKHLAKMRQAGMVVQARGKLYQIPKQYLPAPGQPLVDFGHCLLRLDSADKGV